MPRAVFVVHHLSFWYHDHIPPARRPPQSAYERGPPTAPCVLRRCVRLVLLGQLRCCHMGHQEELSAAGRAVGGGAQVCGGDTRRR